MKTLLNYDVPKVCPSCGSEWTTIQDLAICKLTDAIDRLTEAMKK